MLIYESQLPCVFSLFVSDQSYILRAVYLQLLNATVS